MPCGARRHDYAHAYEGSITALSRRRGNCEGFSGHAQYALKCKCFLVGPSSAATGRRKSKKETVRYGGARLDHTPRRCRTRGEVSYPSYLIPGLGYSSGKRK